MKKTDSIYTIQKIASLKFLFFLFIALSGTYTNAQNTLNIKDDVLHYPLRSDLIQIYKDSSSSYVSPESIQTKLFSSEDSYFFSNPDPAATYWGKFLLTDHSSVNNHWFFISYNYSIDSLDVFAYKNSALLFHKKYRFNFPEETTKEMRHKHFTIDFSIPKNDTITLYIKLKNKNATQYDFALVEHKKLFSESVFEFYLFGLFYGGLILMAFYHLSTYFSLRDKAYVYYSIYIVLQGLYMSYRDSTALVNLFAGTPWLIEYTLNTLFFLLSVSALLYGRSFLKLKNFRLFNILIYIFISIRLPFIFIYKDYPLAIMWIDLVAPVLVFIFSIISRFEKNKTATLFSVGFLAISIGYLINVLWHANIIDCTTDVFYSLYYTIIIQSLLLAIANAYRLNTLKVDKLKKQLLEEKVIENTLMIKHQEELIKEKTDDLDMLLYRASHDIKGPLKSIDGLCYLGKRDQENADMYFENIHLVSKRLQNILNSLLQIAEHNRSEVTIEPVNIYTLINECIRENLVAYPDIKKITFNINVPEDAVINSERFTLLSIIQNIIENAIKYMDKSKAENIVSITFTQSADEQVLTFEDNGIGINEKSLTNIFQMFYRANNVNPGGVGLGLYIVKQHIDRLNGEIEIDSKEHEFTRFTIRFPR
ncbi:sensor histidine kinase [Cytophaga aurantiaca]|uniref:sensor histidine kinase n=1 Tax=Cytophaga aurantiaca TaxID=29530 RepID=UPI00035D2B16|nr:sensor histidine kinase [Cytophaga aurantiaca]